MSAIADRLAAGLAKPKAWETCQDVDAKDDREGPEQEVDAGLPRYWARFAVPLGAPALGMMAAWGVATTIQVFSPGAWTKMAEAKDTEFAASMAVLVMTWPVALGVGWVGHAIMVMP